MLVETLILAYFRTAKIEGVGVWPGVRYTGMAEFMCHSHELKFSVPPFIPNNYKVTTLCRCGTSTSENGSVLVTGYEDDSSHVV